MSSNYEKLKALIDVTQSNKELECRDYLKYAKNLLFKESVIDFLYVETECRARSGDSDYVISGTTKDESGVECNKLYVWELKAPQCYIFEKDTENRLRPSIDLIKAENQLLNYHYELKGNDSIRKDFGVYHPDDVLLGGIIIGCDRTRVRGVIEEPKRSIAYQKATNLRKVLYRWGDIRLMTWDTVLIHIAPVEKPSASQATRVTQTPRLPANAQVDGL